MIGIKTETSPDSLELPDAQKPEGETEPELVPAVGRLIRVKFDSQHEHSGYPWVIIEPFQDVYGKGDFAGIAMPVNKKGEGLSTGGTIHLDQIAEMLGNMDEASVVRAFEAILQKKYGDSLSHEYVVKSVRDAFALQTALDEQPRQV